MRVRIDKSFEKDTKKINNQKLLLKVASCIEQVSKSKSISDIHNLKKLLGFSNHYRIRIGEYRAGIRIVNNEVFFERFLHRKDIYRYYP